jgi:hypothetical protein
VSTALRAGPRTTGPNTSAPPPAQQQKRGFALNAVVLLEIEIWLLVLIPDHLVVGGLGGIGSPALILGALLLPLWGVSVLMPGLGVSRTCTPVRIVVAALWATILVSFAVMNAHAVKDLDQLNSERFLITMAAFTGVAFTAAEGLRNRHDLVRVIRTAVAGSAVMAFIGILQFKPGFDLTKYLGNLPFLTARGDLTAATVRGGFARPSSTALHPIEFGVLMGTFLVFAIYLVLYDRKRSSLRRWLPLALIALAIPVSISRSALLVALAGLLFFFFGTSTSIRRKALAVTGVFVCVIFVGVPGLLGTLKGYIFAGNSDSSISHRTGDFAYAAPFLRESPLIGRGAGSYTPIEFRVLDDQWLVSLIEIGVIGTVALAAVVVTPMFLGRGMRKRSVSVADRTLGNAFAGAACGAIFAFVTYDALAFPTYTAMFALVLGMSGAAWCLARQPGWNDEANEGELRAGWRPPGYDRFAPAVAATFRLDSLSRKPAPPVRLAPARPVAPVRPAPATPGPVTPVPVAVAPPPPPVAPNPQGRQREQRHWHWWDGTPPPSQPRHRAADGRGPKSKSSSWTPPN